MEQVDHEHKDFDEIRKKRFASDHDNDGHIVIFESEASGGECGLKQWNTEKMTAPRKEAIALSQIAKDDGIFVLKESCFIYPVLSFSPRRCHHVCQEKETEQR